MIEAIPEALVGERIDRVVALLTGLSRSQVVHLIEKAAVTCNERVVTSRSQRVELDDVVAVDLAGTTDGPAVAADPAIEVDVLYEDDHLAVLNKPAGLVVHPGAGNPSGTLANGLLARWPDIASVGEADRPGIVHRLDKGTSGVLVVALSTTAYDGLVAQLAAHEVERTYRALVWGDVEGTNGVVEAAIGRSRRDPTKMTVTPSGKPARTRYRVDRRSERPALSLLTCWLDTGRTHQIRVHLTSIGHPVVGDAKYRGAPPPAGGLDRPWLHAARLRFTHPITGVEVDQAAPLPSDLTTVLDRLQLV
ncbi:MAG: RluA family pseudouridine synthase [Acidimicrobiales bacterium]|nr:RluA family pseudouridine synthase [Acidimicrobiales bacterium]